MARDGTQVRPVARQGSLGARVARAWQVLAPEQRLAAGAAIGLVLVPFLPWYQETIVSARVREPVSASLTGWAAFSWVEAAVLLVAGAVLTLLFHRAERRAFHLPGGDGFVIMLAGLWTCALLVWRIFDKQSMTLKAPGLSTTGIEWGIFVALGLAATLALAGSRLRAAHRPEPPLPGEEDPAAGRAPARPRGSRSPAEPTAVTLAAPPEPPSVRASRRVPPAEREPGWLSARPRHLDEDPTVAREEQLTIPLDGRDGRP